MSNAQSDWGFVLERERENEREIERDTQTEGERERGWEENFAHE